MKNFIVVSFYTPNGIYRKMVERLAKSCRTFDIPYEIQELKDKGSWVKNCNQKAEFIKNCLNAHENIVWVDSDAIIIKYPTLFETTQAEFGIRAEPGKKTRKQIGREEINLPHNWPVSLGNIWFNSGTMLFRQSPNTKKLIDRWIELGEQYPTNWDQWNLQQAWADTQPITEWFPREYCQIDKLHGTKQAIVLHSLASVMQKVDRK
jgi:hypothetical protein